MSAQTLLLLGFVYHDHVVTIQDDGILPMYVARCSYAGSRFIPPMLTRNQIEREINRHILGHYVSFGSSGAMTLPTCSGGYDFTKAPRLWMPAWRSTP